MNSIFLLFIFASIASANSDLSARYEIFKQIFTSYNKNMRPVSNRSEVTTVFIDPVLYSIENINEVRETIVFNQWYHTEWNDPFVAWNPDDFNGITSIEVPSENVWVPDINIFGVLSLKETPSQEQTFCDIYSHGIVHCSFNQIVTSHCEYHILLFPFDVQNCSIKYGSWKYGASQIDLQTNGTKANINFFQSNTEWNLISMTNKRVVTNYTREAFVDIIYHLVIRRKPLYYVLTLMLPSFIITTMALIGLFSPFSARGERQEKVTMGLTTLLTMAVLLLVISNQMPKTSVGLPLIGLYILIEIGISSLAACATVAVMRLNSQASMGKPVPLLLLKLTRIGTKAQEKKAEDKTKKNDVNANSQETYDNMGQDIGSTLEMNKVYANVVLEQCLGTMMELKKFVDEKKEQSDVIQLWSRVCDRIDMFLMCAFNMFHIFITCFIFIIPTFSDSADVDDYM